MEELVNIIAKLRAPDGCPWDRKQTHATLVPYLLEEAWEVIDEIHHGNIGEALCEELGDLLLQVLLHAQIASEDNRFNFQDVVDVVKKKMIDRHPHVFAPTGREMSDEELGRQWQRLKSEEKSHQSVLDGLSPTIPSLMVALKMGKQASKLGFDWKKPADVVTKIQEELDEVKDILPTENKERLEEEVGDLLFSVTNLARHLKINPEIALKKGNDKFKRRFQQVEKEIQAADSDGRTLTEAEMEDHWQKAKRKADTDS